MSSFEIISINLFTSFISIVDPSLYRYVMSSTFMTAKIVTPNVKTLDLFDRLCKDFVFIAFKVYGA